MLFNKNDLLTYAEIDLKALKHNLNVVKQLCKRQGKGDRPKILAVVKADAYGHGMLEVASVLNREGVDFFGVSNVVDGKLLRKLGIKKPILLFESTLPEFAKEIVDYKLTPTICTLNLAKALNDYAKKRKRFVDVHIKIDTGMGRLGVWHENALEFIREILWLPYLTITGVATHFPVADTNPGFTQRQIKSVVELLYKVRSLIGDDFYVHVANSMGVCAYQLPFNLVRPGLMLYGLYPTDKLKRKINLKPVMGVKTRVIFVKDVPKGRGISYGHTFVTRRPMKIATLAIGYSDGYFRCLSNKASVLINGQKCPVVGRVTMDQIMVDVSKVKDVRLGDEAVIFGSQKNVFITAEELASHAGTINYEVVCNLGNRLLRVYRG